MVEVRGKSLEKALKLLRREAEPVLKQVKDREYYLSPSERRKRKNYRAQRRREKMLQ